MLNNSYNILKFSTLDFFSFFLNKTTEYLLIPCDRWHSDSFMIDRRPVQLRIVLYIGFTAPEIHNKWSLRASITGELVFDNVKIPKENLLPNKSGLGAPLMCLDSARYGISWGVIGAAMDCYDTARRYSLERIQFDRPLASFQLIQKKLAEMLTEITKAQLLSWRLGTLMNEGKATSAQISMAKRNNVEIAINIAREARQMLGGMGITGEYPIMRHSMNLESVITYEGTHDIHLLILGKEITGIQAFV